MRVRKLRTFESFADFKTCNFFKKIPPKYLKVMENKNILKTSLGLKSKKASKIFDVLIKRKTCRQRYKFY